MRYTPNSRAVTQFNVAVNQSTKNQQTGEWVEETDWFRVSVWGDRAERMAESAAQGQQGLRGGSLQDPRVRGPRRPDSEPPWRSPPTRSSTSSAGRATRTARSTPSGRPVRRRCPRRRWRCRPQRRARPTTPTSTTCRSDGTDPEENLTHASRPIAQARRLLPRPPPPQGLRVLRGQDHARSTTRRSTASAATSRSAPRSSRVERPARAPGTSASWPWPSSAPVTSRCSRTRRSTCVHSPRAPTLAADAPALPRLTGHGASRS